MLELVLPMVFGLSLFSAAFMSIGANDHTDDEGDNSLNEDRATSGDFLDEIFVSTESQNVDSSEGSPSDETESYIPEATSSVQFDVRGCNFEFDAEAQRSYSGSDGNDTISVNLDTSERPDLAWYGENLTAFVKISGGAGDDVINLSGSGYVTYGDGGNDTIDLGDASNVAVFGSERDLIIGGEGRDVFVSVSGDATFVGAEGDDRVQSTSTSETHLGDGSDSFIGANRISAQHVFGDDGDDYLIGSIRSPGDLWSVHEGDGSLVSYDSDTLDGGAGDDTLIGSHGDVLVGGAGLDSFTAVLDCVVGSEPLVIEDFIPTQDIISIHCDPHNDGSQVSPDDFRHVVTPSHDSEITTANGQVLVLLKGVTDLEIGIQNWDSVSESYETVDLDGERIDQDLCDIIISNQIAEFGV